MRRMDLLPVAYVEQRKEKRNITLILLVAGIVVLLLLAWYFMLGSQISSAKTELADIQRSNRLLETQIAELQRFALLDAEVTAKKTALQTVFAGDIDWPGVMTEIAMVTPGEVWLAGLDGSGGTLASDPNLPVDPGAVGTLEFNANSASCMPGVAKWLVRMAAVDEFDAAWIGNAAEPDSRPGCEPPVVFDGTLELNKKALSHRFEGELE